MKMKWFEVYMDYRVELDGEIWKNGSKTQILEKKIQGTARYRKCSVFLFRPVFVC